MADHHRPLEPRLLPFAHGEVLDGLETPVDGDRETRAPRAEGLHCVLYLSYNVKSETAYSVQTNKRGGASRCSARLGPQREISITAGAVFARSAWMAVGEPSALTTVTRSYEYFPVHTRARATGANVREQG